MKEAELRKHATCNVCGNKIGKSGLPLFWRVTVERFGIDMRTVERQQGLAMMLGGNGLIASIMGTDEDMAEPVMEPAILTVCETCCTKSVCIAELAELTPNSNW